MQTSSQLYPKIKKSQSKKKMVGKKERRKKDNSDNKVDDEQKNACHDKGNGRSPTFHYSVMELGLA